MIALLIFIGLLLAFCAGWSLRAKFTTACTDELYDRLQRQKESAETYRKAWLVECFHGRLRDHISRNPQNVRNN